MRQVSTRRQGFCVRLTGWDFRFRNAIRNPDLAEEAVQIESDTGLDARASRERIRMRSSGATRAGEAGTRLIWCRPSWPGMTHAR